MSRSGGCTHARRACYSSPVTPSDDRPAANTSHDTLAEARAAIARHTRLVADFPSPGVQFKDLTPVLAESGGFASIIHGEFLARGGDKHEFLTLAVGEEPLPLASRPELLALCGLDAAGIYRQVRAFVQRT